MPSLLLKLSISATATALTLVGLEAATRALHLAPQINPISLNRSYGTFVSSTNPILKYVPKPGSKDTNSFGFRDREYSLKKQPGTLRVGVIGDSIAYGYCNPSVGLPVEDTFANKLEKRLNSDGDLIPVEVLNFAVSGYDTPQEVEFLETVGVQFDLDLVIVSYCLNDSQESSAELADLRKISIGTTNAGLVESVSKAYAFMFLHSDLFRWLALRLTRPPSPDRPSVDLTRNYRKVEAALERLSLRFPGKKTLIVVFPLFFSFEPHAWLADRNTVKGLAEKNNFDFLDLLGAFRDASGNSPEVLQSPCNAEHPNAEGHSVAAEAIYKHLKAEKFANRP